MPLQGRPARQGVRFGPAALAFAYAALAVLLNIVVWRAPAARYVGIGNDPEQTMWFLVWTPTALSHLKDPFLSDYLNYPTGMNTLWNIWVPLPGILLWPVTAMFGPVVGYNVLVTASPALAAWLAFIAIRRIVATSWAAAVGGLIYGFSPMIVAQSLGHVHVVVSAITPPLIVLLLHELLVRRRWRPAVAGALLAGVLCLQFFIAEEFMLIDVGLIVLAVGITAALWRDGVRSSIGYVLRALMFTALVSTVVLVGPIALQLLGPDRVNGAIHDVNTYATDPLNFVVPTSIQALAPHWATTISARFTGNVAEQNGYLGIPLVLLVGFTVIRYRRVRLVLVTGLVTLIVAVLSLGPHLHLDGTRVAVPLPGIIFEHVPLADDVLPARMMGVAYLGAAMLAAFALSRMQITRHTLWRPAAVTALLLVTLFPAVPLPSTPVSVPAYFTSGSAGSIPEGAVALGVPWPETNDAKSMLWQAASGMRYRLLGGYVLGPPSPGQEALHALLDAVVAQQGGTIDPESRTTLLGVLRRTGVSAVILGPVAGQEGIAASLSGALGSAPTAHDGVDVWSAPFPAA